MYAKTMTPLELTNICLAQQARTLHSLCCSVLPRIPNSDVHYSHTGPGQDMWTPWASLKFGAPSNRYSLNICGLGQGWGTLLRAHAQTADNFQRNSFMFPWEF